MKLSFEKAAHKILVKLTLCLLLFLACKALTKTINGKHSGAKKPGTCCCTGGWPAVTGRGKRCCCCCCCCCRCCCCSRSRSRSRPWRRCRWWPVVMSRSLKDAFRKQMLEPARSSKKPLLRCSIENITNILKWFRDDMGHYRGEAIIL